jgi:hypothetical protein
MVIEPQSPESLDEAAWRKRWIRPPLEEELKRLTDALGRVTADSTSPYLTRVKRLIVDGTLKGELGITLYDETVWGVIRWRRGLGRPATPAMADGFVIVHEYCLCVDAGQNPDGSERMIGDWVPASTPQVWEGPDDTETHCVGFMLRGVKMWKNRVLVDLVPGVEWQPADAPWLTQRRRVVRYPPSLIPDGEFTVPKGAAPMDLDEFAVVRTW